ncbi:MAG: SDR family NAD(P)-dependent oxidoreductase [Candidatus Nanohaloarchaeota archaeon QJJ-9]|nr:SDR family NAD(P)-dependent oxidoreductase [Candidatus Nanohaloarchaeota archaeon QJJ-9]
MSGLISGRGDRISKKVLVTGGAGFIGAHLCKRLLTKGHEVICFDNLSRFGEKKLEELDSDSFKFIRGDIRNFESYEKILERVDIVFHLASVSRVEEARDNPIECFDTNLLGSWKLLRACGSFEVDKLVFASSREVFGDCKNRVGEREEFDPNNLYGFSKAEFENVLDFFGNHTSVNTVSMRLSNVYGPGDRGRVIPIFLERLRNNKPLKLYGGDQILDFVWIEDVIKVFQKAMQEDFPYRKVNVGSGKGVSVRELAEKIIDIAGKDVEVRELDGKDFETKRYVTDTSRMRGLGVSPTSLREGLEKLLVER